MNQKEIESVTALEPLERYKYFIKKVADAELFFTLVDKNGDYVLSELEEQKLFPMWSSVEYAELCKVNGWEKHSIKQLDLDDLENEIIDFIADEDCLINVFPVNDNTGFVVSLTEFSRDLGDELSKYG
ncbi:DUF2750 domain-containing protein [Chryseobacterium bernardetii]|uniref:DUF2750 domain-containing protein n=1 Tax=Chryseobacterium bernardetii TaxID=1241978 RepID=UPI0016267C32|nr:DUF2750 domain-containing protein [Chryseobacterium bernardetii]